MVELFRQGIAIVDDNNPAPENVPRQGETTAGTVNWRREGIIFPHKSGNLQNSFASFRHYLHDSILRMSLLQLFLIMLPEEYIEKVLIPDTSKGRSVPMDIQEFIKCVGCWIYMACWVGIENRQDWWYTTTPLMAKGAPFRINRIMYRNWFDYIISAIIFTNREVPYEDRFFQMRQLEEAWKQNMSQQCFPSWINVLDDYMMEWFNKWALGFMCVIRKPHPFGNKRHTICCALTSILWREQIL